MVSEEFMNKSIRLDEQLIGKMRRVIGSFKEVGFAAVFGSLVACKETYHDMDVALKIVSGDKYDVICKIIEGLSSALNMPEERIDCGHIGIIGKYFRKCLKRYQ